MSYLILIAGILCALLACLCLALFFSILPNKHDPDTDSRIKVRQKIAVGAGMAFLITAYTSWRIWSYLFLNNPDILEYFGLWYIGGFVSRFLILFKRHELLSPRFAPEWTEISTLPFWALLGPVVTLYLIKVVLWEKNWFDD